MCLTDIHGVNPIAAVTTDMAIFRSQRLLAALLMTCKIVRYIDGKRMFKALKK